MNNNIPKLSKKAQLLYDKLLKFMDGYVYTRENEYNEYVNKYKWHINPIIEELKIIAKKQGLWNLFLPSISGITNVEYAHLAEVMGRNLWAAEVFNCQFPDTGNMETLHLFGNFEQKEKWLKPLMNGDIRSSFVMTEPEVASSDAVNMKTTIMKDGNEYIINGHKYWISGAGDPRCKCLLILGRSTPINSNKPRHRQHSIVICPIDTPGITIHRAMTAYGYDDNPYGHMDITFENVRIPINNLLYEEGAGFQIAQARLGPGRIHHCMRTIGLAERSLEMMIKRVTTRIAFNKPLAQQGTIRRDIADCRIWITQTRLLCLYAAHLIDQVGAKDARQAISMIKVEAPIMALKVIDRVIQCHGAAGLSQDFPLSKWYARTRTVRFMDGPDEVHRETIAKLELRKHGYNSKL